MRPFKLPLAFLAPFAFFLSAGASAAPYGYVPDVISPFYFTGNGSNTQGSFGLQGIKSWSTEGWFIVTGTSGINGVVYIGPLDHGSSVVPSTTSSNGSVVLTPVNQIPSCVSAGGSGSGQGLCNGSATVSQGGWFVMNLSGYGTSIYGPDVVNSSTVNLVGSLSPLPGSSGPTKGFYYTGPITDQPNQANFTVYQGSNRAGRLADYTYIHSTSGGAQGVPLAVGNYGFQGSVGSPFGHAFIYNPSTGKQIDIVYPPSSGDLTHTAYGIWYNPDGTYTIAGGVGLSNQPQSDYVYGEPLPLGKAYLMDYNPNLSQPFSNYQEYNYSPKGADKQSFRGKAIITHFEGIWRDPKTGNYRLPATATYTAANGAPSLELARAKTVTVSRNKNGKFSTRGVWNDVPVAGGSVVTNDSISGDNSIGFVLYPAVTSASGTSISPAIPSTYVINPIKRP